MDSRARIKAVRELLDEAKRNRLCYQDSRATRLEIRAMKMAFGYIAEVPAADIITAQRLAKLFV